MSLKGFQITEADAWPVEMAGSRGTLGGHKTLFKKHQASNKQGVGAGGGGGENPGRTLQVASSQKPCTICQTVKPFSVGHLPFQIIFKNCFYKIL